MSYFEESVEPNLHNIPKQIKNRVEKEVEMDFFSIPTDARKVPWRGADGLKISIEDMTDRHLNNAHSLLGRRLGTCEQKSTDHVYYGFLRAEMNRRCS